MLSVRRDSSARQRTNACSTDISNAIEENSIAPLEAGQGRADNVYESPLDVRA
jgi:hypothetical protein